MTITQNDVLQKYGFDKTVLLQVLAALKNTKLNVLMVGGTGVGKSSTINALFNMDSVKVGTGSMPETSQIEKFELNNLVIWDTPGLGDSTDNDARYKQMMTEKLQEKDGQGNALIDLVFLVLDGGSRDYASAYELLKSVIVPNLGADAQDRLLIGINQADMAMKGRHWSDERNEPEPTLINFLEEKVQTTRDRIKADTSIDVEPIYYSAGFKDGDQSQKPYNLAKVFDYIMAKLPRKKRIILMTERNTDNTQFEKNDGKKDYQQSTLGKFINAVAETAKEVAGAVADLGKTVWEEVKKPENIKLIASSLLGLFTTWAKGKEGK